MSGEQLRSASIVLVTAEGELLMQLRDFNTDLYPGFWDYPGGRVEESDPCPKTAAIREIEEETGYLVDWEDTKFLMRRWVLLPDGRAVLSDFYWARYDGVQEISCFEGAEMKFKHFSEIPRLEVCPNEDDIHQAVMMAAFREEVE